MTGNCNLIILSSRLRDINLLSTPFKDMENKTKAKKVEILMKPPCLLRKNSHIQLSLKRTDDDVLRSRLKQDVHPLGSNVA